MLIRSIACVAVALAVLAAATDDAENKEDVSRGKRRHDAREMHGGPF